MFVLHISAHLMGHTFISQLHDILLQCHSHPFCFAMPETTEKMYYISITSTIAIVTLRHCYSILRCRILLTLSNQSVLVCLLIVCCITRSGPISSELLDSGRLYQHARSLLPLPTILSFYKWRPWPLNSIQHKGEIKRDWGREKMIPGVEGRTNNIFAVMTF